ncbi:MAG TPA: sulfite exporter TauE/SafE family protein [Burkholderiales bacterium]|nr:sulfite exporter TauE/SafE family protein [Burkholderiales bacterium]
MDWWWAYLVLGGFVGFFSGLLGIGGGSVMVPILTFIFAGKQLAPTHVVHIALGTGMATILFTSAASVVSHHRHRAVNWRILRDLAPGVVVGTFCGALLAGYLSRVVLGVLFAAIVYFNATQLLLDINPKADRGLPGTAGMWFAGSVIGALSSLAALAGASLTVPFLVRRNVRMHEAIGTAAAVGWPLSFAGTLGYVVSGIGADGLPEHSVGFVYLPAVFWIVIASVIMAPLGARVAHRTRAGVLKRIFAVLLYALATRMLWSLLTG